MTTQQHASRDVPCMLLCGDRYVLLCLRVDIVRTTIERLACFSLVFIASCNVLLNLFLDPCPVTAADIASESTSRTPAVDLFVLHCVLY